MMEKDNDTKTIKDEDKISICELMKDDTSEIIRKFESKIPLYFQNYSNMYQEYFHMWSGLFGTCYIAEKEFLDKFDLDQGIKKQMKEISRITKENYLYGIESATKLWDDDIKMRSSAIKSFDDYVHVMIESYSKILSQFSNSLKLPQ